MADTVTLKIPRPLYNRLQETIKDTGFKSVTEFVVYVLRDLVSTHELHVSSGPEGDPLTSQERELIRKRLRALGYLE